MSKDSIDKKTQELILHFDVGSHTLPASEFFQFVRNVEVVVGDLTNLLLGEKAKYEIRIKPPEKGSFISEIVINVIGGIIVLGALPYVKGLTGKSFDEHAEALGEKTFDVIKKSTPKVKALQKKINTKIVVDSAKSFLEKSTDQLIELGVFTSDLYKAYKAKNEFYKTCQKNAEIKGLGFDKDQNFEITRPQFSARMASLNELPHEQVDHGDWKLETVDINVYAPNWDTGDKHPWRAHYNKKCKAEFKLEDPKFLELIEKKHLEPKVVDSLKVQWAYKIEGRKKTKFRVLNVLEYNGKKMFDLLSDAELQKLLNEWVEIEEPQPDMFNEMYYIEKNKEEEPPLMLTY